MLFRRVFGLTEFKDHLTKEGFSILFALKNSMNLGLSLELKNNFSDLEQIARAEVNDIFVHNLL